jgi:hypothetical protein
LTITEESPVTILEESSKPGKNKPMDNHKSPFPQFAGKGLSFSAAMVVCMLQPLSGWPLLMALTSFGPVDETIIFRFRNSHERSVLRASDPLNVYRVREVT